MVITAEFMDNDTFLELLKITSVSNQLPISAQRFSLLSPVTDCGCS